jgi:hypothetical protein
MTYLEQICICSLWNSDPSNDEVSIFKNTATTYPGDEATSDQIGSQRLSSVVVFQVADELTIHLVLQSE